MYILLEIQQKSIKQLKTLRDDHKKDEGELVIDPLLALHFKNLLKNGASLRKNPLIAITL